MEVLDVKAGDTRPSLRVTLLDDTTPIDLTAATEVKIVLRSDRAVIERAVTGSDVGVAVLDWQPGDLYFPGVYQGEVQVSWSDGSTQTFPGDGYFVVRVRPQLD